MTTYATTDLCDDHPNDVRVIEENFISLGKRKAFHGQAFIVKTFEDNTKVRGNLETPGNGRVMVVDGGGSRRCALFGGKLAVLAAENGWAGVIINGCARDADEIDAEDTGVKALQLHPKKSNKDDGGVLDVPVRFGGQTINPGDWVYADRDGVVISSKPVHEG